jgi:hypothetical protein
LELLSRKTRTKMKPRKLGCQLSHQSARKVIPHR